MGLPYCFDETESKSILSKLCKDEGLDDLLIREICEIELSFEGSGRADGVYDEIARAMEAFTKRVKSSDSRLSTKKNNI